MAISDDDLAHTATAPGTSTPRTPADPVGATLGRYRLERMLGEGGMGVVHAAFDPDLERRVALKVLRSADGSDEARQRLLREARAMARLTHANVVAVHEVGTAGDRDYVAMELIDGQTLADWLDTKPPHRIEEIIAAFVAAGRGIAAAHAAGLVHRDFKPHNVLRGRDGRIVVTDFGLARGVEATKEQRSLETTLPLLPTGGAAAVTPSSLSGLTRTGSVLGTPAYMAPEQWSGGTVGPEADQFAFCVALWEAITGERPYRGDTIEALKEQIKRGPAALDASKLPRALRRPLLRGLDPDVARRWPSMDLLLAAITRRRRGPGFALAGAGAALVALGVAFLVLHGDDAPECDRPAIDPDSAWSVASASATPSWLGDVFVAKMAAWKHARKRACTAEPVMRAAQLHCLDGALARIDAVRQAYSRVPKVTEEDALIAIVDPAVCLSPTPPRLSMPDSHEVVGALELFAKTLSHAEAVASEQDARAFAERPGLEPCAHAIASLALADSATEISVRRDSTNEAVAMSDQCDDDRLRAESLVRAAPYQFELPLIGAKGQAAVRRAEVAAERINQPSLTADVDFHRSFIASQQQHWKEAFELTDHAVKILDDNGLHRSALDFAIEGIEMRLQRAEADDLAVVRATVARWKPIALRLDEKALIEDLERDDALARWVLGDVAGGHAELLRVWHPPAHMHEAMKIDGHVVDRTGKPVAGATVAVGRNLRGDSVGVPLLVFRLHYGDRDVRSVTTDANGHFAFAEAPDRGAIVAQLGDRRSNGTAIADHLTLVLQPTHRISGKVALGNMPFTEAMIVLQAPDATDEAYKLIGPVAPDGTFAIDGAPVGKQRIAVAISSQQFGMQLEYKDVPASSEPIGGIKLAVPTTGRSLDVVARSTLSTPLDAAQIIVIAGRVQIHNVGALFSKSNLLSLFAHHVVGEAVPHDAVDKMKPGDLVAHFINVPAGEITVCAIGLGGDMMDAALMRKLQAHLAELELKCETIGGDAKSLIIAAPPQKRLD